MIEALSCAGLVGIVSCGAFPTELHGGGVVGDRIERPEADDAGHAVLHGASPPESQPQEPCKDQVTFQDTDGDEVSFVRERHGRLAKYVNGQFSRVVTSLTFSRRQLRLEDQEHWGGSLDPAEVHVVCSDLRKLALCCNVATNLPQIPKVPCPTEQVVITFNVQKLLTCAEPDIANRVRRATQILMQDIPGVTWAEVKSGGQLRITGDNGDGCWSYVGYQRVNKMNLAPDFGGPPGPRLGTVLHELLHCLGMSHQHQRDDRDGFVVIDPRLEQKNKVNFAKDADVHPYRYDSASIMHYPSSDTMQPGASAWSCVGQRRQLSQLDKTFMNMLYPPIPGSSDYNPRQGTTGLWYCGRRVMTDNNFPYGLVGCDGRCGPTNGPNCPSCIIFGVSRGQPYPLVTVNGRMQGDTGLFYCGRKMQAADANHDGYCGPHNGPCCSQCFQALGGSSGSTPIIVRR